MTYAVPTTDVNQMTARESLMGNFVYDKARYNARKDKRRVPNIKTLSSQTMLRDYGFTDDELPGLERALQAMFGVIPHPLHLGMTLRFIASEMAALGYAQAA